MRRQSSFPYILALLAATQVSLVAAAESPVVPAPHTWLTTTQAPASPISWRSPLQSDGQGAFPQSPQILGATRTTSSKDSVVVSPQTPTGHCSSSGTSSQAIGCAAFIALTAAVHSVQQ